MDVEWGFSKEKIVRVLRFSMENCKEMAKVQILVF